jgi:mannose-1-phosphate guanylyltransferase
LTFGIVSYKAGEQFWIHRAQGDDVISFREKPNKFHAREFIAKGNFYGAVECFALRGFVGRLCFQKYIEKSKWFGMYMEI